MKNELTKVSFIVDIGELKGEGLADNIVNKITKSLVGIDSVYSYIIYNKNDKSIGRKENIWKIVSNISSIPYYNTIIIKDMAINIANCIIEDKFTSNICGYKQPCVDIVLRTNHPLIKTLSLRFLHQWTMLEYDDIYQTCMLALLRLYKNNYYIHKNLIVKTCTNEILQLMRSYKNLPTILSLESTLEGKADDKALCILDTIMDESEIIEKDNQEIKDANLSVYNEVKDILIDKFGARRFDRLYNAYAKNMGCNTAARDLVAAKQHLKSMGITRKSFDKYL